MHFSEKKGAETRSIDFKNPILKALSHHLLNSISFEALQDQALPFFKNDAPTLLTLLNTYSSPSFTIHFFKNNHLEDSLSLAIVGPGSLPFLVDSLLNHLKINNFDINLIAHTDISIIRNPDGDITELTTAQNDPVSILYFQLEKCCTPDSYALFTKEISQILQCLTLSFQDWHPMVSHIQSIANNEIFITHTQAEHDTKSLELTDFLHWLIADNFIFLGSFDATLESNSIIPDINSYKGVCRSELYPIDSSPAGEYYSNEAPLLIRKWNSPSVIHRTAHMDWLIIKNYNMNGKLIGTHNFVGFFTSSTYYQSILSIPLIREKVGAIIARYGYPETSYNRKELITAMESFSRSELLQMDENELYETATGIVALTLSPGVRLFVRKEVFSQFINCVVFIPQDRFSIAISQIIETLLCDKFNGSVSKQHIKMLDPHLARIRIVLKINSTSIPQYDIKAIEAEIVKIISLWSDHLFDHLCIDYGRSKARELYHKFKNAFDMKYTYMFSAKEATHDITLIEKAISTNSVQFYSYAEDQESLSTKTLHLKIYSPHKELSLSDTLPKLENAGLYACNMLVYDITLKQDDNTLPVFIYHFYLRHSTPTPTTLSSLENLVETLAKVWSHSIDNDRFNSLVIACQLDWRHALIFRSYSSYLKQINFPLTASYIINTLLSCHNLTSKLAQLFELKFNPNLPHNTQSVEAIQRLIEEGLQTIDSSSQEKVMSTIYSLIKATKRVNFYQTDPLGHFKEYLSFKIASSEVADIPLPKPFAEIFVYSIKFRGIHLRGGKVARGGIRWSDRSEDLRTEILGLMKAQVTKNAVIVPTGSKGGFVLKGISPENGREQFMKAGIECYKLFLSGLLDLTDNIIDGNVISPEKTICHDTSDPYLVVAADKGTATFSDTANEISQQYNFWLGDAFASGGSAGYDHKKLGITARGAWISVLHHFSDIGINIEQTEFTTVGIGDMSGDVFGNGALLSNKMKLLAAFNHQHIFLDPTPDPSASFAERKRLFNLPNSRWSDYDSTLISNGGGVFSRDAKYISITPEVKKALHIEHSSLTPNQLISSILKAPVDLLWNGGIGTYVKAKDQTNEQVGDKANDPLRINGYELRCKVVGEGGNLGMTQLGRIEYARNNGRVNTDFIDNSAGVDCSDHEVNIKISLNGLVKSGRLSLQERNKLLENMAQEVSALVLEDNTQQALLLSLEEAPGIKRLSEHTWLIKHLSETGVLNCEVESLPSIETLSLMEANQLPLTRPEIAVIISYAKNSMFYILSDLELINHSKGGQSTQASSPDFITTLLNYFPSQLRNEFSQDLINHKLGNEIVAAELANSFINMLGCTFFHQLLELTGESPLRIIKAFFAVRHIFDVDVLWQTIEQSNSLDKLSSLIEIQSLLSTTIEAMLYRHHILDDVASVVSNYKPYIPQILESIPTTTDIRDHLIYTLRNSEVILDIIHIKNCSTNNLQSIMEAYLAVDRRMYFSWLKQKIALHTHGTHLHKMALKTLLNDLGTTHIELTLHHLTHATENENKCSIPFSNEPTSYHHFINELKSYTGDDWISMLVMALYHSQTFMKSGNVTKMRMICDKSLEGDIAA